MAIRNLGQIIDDAISFIQSKIPGLSLLAGTVARDVVIEAPAQEFDKIWQELARVEKQQQLNDASVFTDEELTNLATSFGVQRAEGVAATGTVTFRLTTFSTLSSDIIIPLGTEVSTRSSLSVNAVITFNTTAQRIFVAANANTYFNPTTGFYEVNAPIQAAVTGTAGNVGGGSIVVLVTTISGAPTVSNSSATSGGTAPESNDALLSRILTKLTGTAAGTVNGILSLVNSNPNVVSSLVVVPGDIELVRDEFGNAADVLIIGEIQDPVEENRVFTAGITDYILSRQPVISDDAAVEDIIEGVVAGLGFNFIKGTHFRVAVDNNSLTRGSIRAGTKIIFLGSPFPDATSTFTVRYSINGLVEEIQAALDASDFHIIGTDILVREAVKVLIRVGAIIKVKPGFTRADVASTAEDNVAELLNSITLDTDVDQSDIIATIQNTTGVDSVTIPITLEIKRPTDPAFILTSDVVIARTEYGRPDTSVGAITIV